MTEELNNNRVLPIYNAILVFKQGKPTINLSKKVFEKLENLSLENINSEEINTFVYLMELIQYETKSNAFYNMLIEKLKSENNTMYHEFMNKIHEKTIEIFSQLLTNKNHETLFKTIFETALDKNVTLNLPQSRFINHPILRNSELCLEVSIAYPLFNYWQKLGLYKQCFFWKLLLSHPNKNEVIQRLLKDAHEVKIQTEKRIFVSNSDSRSEKLRKELNTNLTLKEKDLLELLIQPQEIIHHPHKVQKL